MEAQIAQFSNRGMNQDISVSKATNEFAFKNHNIRITAVNDNTLLSITNEKLPSNLNIEFKNDINTKFIPGIYLGHAILNEYLVLFTTTKRDDYILVFTYNNSTSTLLGEIKYQGNLGFKDVESIECLPYYESEDIQKVYWVDGVHQPRVINIKSDSILEKVDTQFDFNPTITKFPNVTITKEYQGIGLFPAGVIQYFISYYNKYGAETGIVWASDLNYVSYSDRGGSPTDNIVCNFKLDISNIDTTYDYIRVYSLERTSLNTTPICRIVKDTSINNASNITVVDTNTNTETIDPTQLLFLGGDNFVASTLTQKDDVLFLGDLEVKNIILDDTLKTKLSPTEGTYNKYLAVIYTNRAKEDNKTFKVGEWYRIGIQFQSSMGDWTNPVWIGDIQIPTKDEFNGSLSSDKLPSIVYDLNAQMNEDSELAELLLPYSNFRLLMVEAKPTDRTILAQGFVVPTVFNLEQRVNKTGPYAISSWIIRPRLGNANYEHLSPLGNKKDGDEYTNLKSCEIQNSINKYPVPENVTVNYVLSFEILVGSNYITPAIYKLSEEELPTPNDEYFAKSIKTLVSKEELTRDVNSNRWEDIENYNLLVNWYSQYVNKDLISFSYEAYKSYIESVCYNNITEKYSTITLIDGTSMWYSGYITNGLDNPFETSKNKFDYNVKIGAFARVNTEEKVEQVIKSYQNNWYVDSSIVTFHSPELENNESLFKDASLKFRIVGLAAVSDVASDVTLLTKTEAIKSDGGLIKSYWEKSNKQLLNAPLYQDYAWRVDALDKAYTYNYYVYLWNKKGSITGQTSNSNDGAAKDPQNFDKVYAELEHKIIANKTITSHIKFLKNTDFYSVNTSVYNSNQLHTIYVKDFKGDDIVYQGNIETVASNEPDAPYKVFWKDVLATNREGNTTDQYDPVYIKYTKTPHLVFSLKEGNNPAILPSLIHNSVEDGVDSGPERLWDLNHIYDKPHQEKYDYLWFDNNEQYSQRRIEALQSTPYIFIGELYRDIPESERFGGTSRSNLEKLNWIPISKAYTIGDSKTSIGYTTTGDTYYQRWEYLNTYPTTEQDMNSVVDIVSTMIETHINLEGRYDKNKESLNILNARPTNFNLINPIYSQSNNYFTYNILEEKFNQTKYRNQVAFSLQKTLTSEIDTWCNISLASSFNLNGLHGKLNKLITVNDNIIAFQDKAISVINFNNRTALSTESGIPIEIANSGKVNGYSTISSNIGCQNKKSICEASSGVYFIDDYNKTMYGFNREGLAGISSSRMSMWFKNNLTGKEQLFYDSLTNDVYITNDKDCLVYNEGLQSFTSFMDYNNIYSLFNFNSTSILLDNVGNIIPKKMFGGDYTSDYSMEYKINPEPLVDKTFGNIEFIADCFNPTDYVDDYNTNLNSSNPFTLLNVWNEYQKGSTLINTKRFRYPNFEKKFRVWRVDIPRDEANGRDRIRNPWIYLKLSKSEPSDKSKMVFHNLIVKYYK